MMRKLLLPFILVGLLASCASPTQFKDVVGSWKGTSAQSLMGSWGYPYQIKLLKKGRHVYIYKLVRKKKGDQFVMQVPTAKGRALAKLKSTTVHVKNPSCVAKFVANANNEVTAVSFHGKNCVADPQFVDAMSNPERSLNYV